MEKNTFIQNQAPTSQVQPLYEITKSTQNTVKNILSPITPPTTDIGMRDFYQIYGKDIFPIIGHQLSHRNLANQLVEHINIDFIDKILSDNKVHSNILLELLYSLKKNGLLSKKRLSNFLSTQRRFSLQNHPHGVLELSKNRNGESILFFGEKVVKGVFLGVEKNSSGSLEYKISNSIYNQFGIKMKTLKKGE